MDQYKIRPIQDSDIPWIENILTSEWGSTIIVTRGIIHKGDRLPGYIAERNDELLGFILYNIETENCEIIALNTVEKGIGVGSSLIGILKDHAKSMGCLRLWLITTNDNVNAQHFYQKRGFVQKAIYPNAIEESRILKPEIPIYGINGIPIRDEIEYELILK